MLLGFGICLTAETTTGIVYCGEAVSPIVPPGGLPCIPEDLGKEAGLKLLDEIHRLVLKFFFFFNKNVH